MANVNIKSVLREIKQQAGPLVAPSPLDPALLEHAVRGIRASHRARKRRTWVTQLPLVANAKTPTGRGQFSSQRNPWRVTIRRLAPYLLDMMPDLSKGQAEGIARSIQMGLRSNAPDSEVAAMIEQYDIDEQRSTLIARTEMARSRADTELGRLKPNERVVYVLADEACPKCVKVERKLKGRKLTAKQAEGIIPVHPNCYCRWKVVNRKSGREIVRNDANGFEEVRGDVLEYSRLVDNCGGEGSGRPGPCPSKTSVSAGIHQTVSAVMKKGEPGFHVAKLDDDKGELSAAIAWKDKGDHFYVEHLGTYGSVPGHGTRLLMGLVNRANKEGKGLKFNSTPESYPYYQKLGFYRIGLNEDEFGAEHGDLGSILKRYRKKLRISKLKPTTNVFCSTGSGGGIDPSCGKSDSNKSNAAREIKKALPDNDEWKNELNDLWDNNTDTMAGPPGTMEEYCAIGLCDLGSRRLQKKLAEKGVVTDLVDGYYDSIGQDHFWLRARDGSIIDATESQFDDKIPIGKITVYTPKDDRYALYTMSKKSKKLVDGLGTQPTTNIFCATGPRGGVDPSCSPTSVSESSALNIYADAIRQIVADSPMPKTEPKPLPPGTSNPNLRAQHPEWTPLIDEYRAHNRAMRKYRIAQSLQGLTRPVPERPVSTGTATDRKRQFLRAVGDLESARNAKSFLDTTTALDHPDGPVILKAAQSEASARYDRLTGQARKHLAALDPSDMEKGRRRLESMALNVFCATGEGGGVDPSCGNNQKDAVKLAGKGVKELLKKNGIKTIISDREDVKNRGGAAYLQYQGVIAVTEDADKFKVLHETGHAVDASLKSSIRVKDRKFEEHGYWSETNLKTVLDAERKAAKPKEIVSSFENKFRAWEYAFSSPREAFAHIFASIKGDDTKVNGFSIQDVMPKTYKKVESFLKSKSL